MLVRGAFSDEQACPEMREIAVQCMGLYSCLDLGAATRNLPLLHQFAMTDLQPIQLAALKSAVGCSSDVMKKKKSRESAVICAYSNLTNCVA